MVIIFGLPIPVLGRCWSCGKGATEIHLETPAKITLWKAPLRSHNSRYAQWPARAIL